MLGCGSSNCGQLGFDCAEDSNYSKFQLLNEFRCAKIALIASGREHTLTLSKSITNDKYVLYSFGGNDLGELGRKGDMKATKPGVVTFSHLGSELCQVCVGTSHNLVCSSSGEVFSWGSNTDSQIGLPESDANEYGLFDTPKLVPFPNHVIVTSVAAGSRHSIALSNTGAVYGWGSNLYGQLGFGRETLVLQKASPIGGIDCLPLSQVHCGSFHTIFITVSGRVFVCGRNNFGQLGLGDTNDRFIITRSGSLKPYFVISAACGELHSIFYCSTLVSNFQEEPKKFLMSCGASANGQLGFPYQELACSTPTVIEATRNLAIRSFSCGRKHSLILSNTHEVYSFGLNNLGQLGLHHTKDVCEPTRVMYIPPVAYVAAGGDQSFCILLDNFSQAPQRIEIFKIESNLAKQFAENPTGFVKDFGMENFACLLKNVFENSRCLNSSFMHNYPSKGCQSSPQQSAVDAPTLIRFFNVLSEMYNTNFNRAIVTAFDSLLPTPKIPADVECLRMFLILSQCHVFDSAPNWKSLAIPFAVSVLKLCGPALKTLKLWLKNEDTRVLGHLLVNYKEVIKYLTMNWLRATDTSPNDQALKALMVSLRMLEMIHSVNKMKNLNEQMPPNRFYVKEFTDKLDIENDYIVWLRKKTNAEKSKASALSNINDQFQVVPVCDFPFIFNVACKSILLACEATVKMQRIVTQLQLSSILNANMEISCPFLVLYIDRKRLLDSTLNQLFTCDEFDLRKPLKIIFEGEDAVDAGGVKKEFFMLVLREILDPKYGMFKIVENSKWFNDIIDDELKLFRMVGMVCGLAIYNQTIIDLMFPLVLYKKLLSQEVGLEDLFSLDPVLAKQLQNLLDYEGEDVEDVFCLNFQIAKDFYGSVVVHDLVPNGGEKAVTHENKNLYVSVYVDYLLNKSVCKQYYEFSTGFFKVVKSDVLSFFHPQELHELISGNQNYDFYELESTASYKGEFNAEHATIKNFWRVIHKMDLERQLKFLLFLTGTERVPVNGMKSLNLTIQPTYGGQEYLPVAHTCFNLLDLPLYPDKETLRRKLLIAIEQTEGFALV